MAEKIPGLTANRPEIYYDVYFGEEVEVLNTLYEKINGVYELTTDTEYDSNKTYYKQYNQKEHPSNHGKRKRTQCIKHKYSAND